MRKSRKHADSDDLFNFTHLPETYRDILIDNRRLIKKNAILQAELVEKNRIIHHLKEEIDATIMEDTKSQLRCIRLIEDQVEIKTAEIKELYLEKIIGMEDAAELQLKTKDALQIELKVEQQKTAELNLKIEALKRYLIDIMEEKDYIISELERIINQQISHVRSCSKCNQKDRQSDKYKQKTEELKKKNRTAAIIKQNE